MSFAPRKYLSSTVKQSKFYIEYDFHDQTFLCTSFALATFSAPQIRLPCTDYKIKARFFIGYYKYYRWVVRWVQTNERRVQTSENEWDTSANQWRQMRDESRRVKINERLVREKDRRVRQIRNECRRMRHKWER